MENPNSTQNPLLVALRVASRQSIVCPLAGLAPRQPRNEPVLKNCIHEHACQSGRWHINDVLKAGANTEEIMELREHLLGRAQSDH